MLAKLLSKEEKDGEFNPVGVPTITDSARK